jgi:2-amino-4-hydroxy-6-hydroxymethyldihydropteridine diphosphokinase
MSPPSFRAYVGLGGNLGDVQATFRSALSQLASAPGTTIEAASSLYRTRPVDADGPDFLNTVVALQSSLGPHELLGVLQRIETAHNRERPFRNAPRTLDLDLLWFGGAALSGLELTLPHPRMHERAFVLAPLAELMAKCPPEAFKPGGNPVLPEASVIEAYSRQQGIERLNESKPWPGLEFQ